MGDNRMAQIAAALEELRDGGPSYHEVGICPNVREITPVRASELAVLMHGWPEHTGYDAFPVPHPTLPADEAYFRHDELWAGEYGAARKRLLDYMIERAHELAREAE